MSRLIDRIFQISIKTTKQSIKKDLEEVEKLIARLPVKEKVRGAMYAEGMVMEALSWGVIKNVKK